MWQFSVRSGLRSYESQGIKLTGGMPCEFTVSFWQFFFLRTINSTCLKLISIHIAKGLGGTIVSLRPNSMCCFSIAKKKPHPLKSLYCPQCKRIINTSIIFWICENYHRYC